MLCTMLVLPLLTECCVVVYFVYFGLCCITCVLFGFDCLLCFLVWFWLLVTFRRWLFVY